MRDTPSAAIGFVDVLIGAMASAVLLFMAQAAVPPAKPGFGRGEGLVRVTGTPSKEGAGLNLAVRFRVNGATRSGLELAAAGDRRVLCTEEDGRLEYEVKFGENPRFGPGDELLVYIHDPGSGPRRGSSVGLRFDVVGKGRPVTFDLSQDPQRAFDLAFEHPVLVVPLAHVSGQRSGATPNWSRP